MSLNSWLYVVTLRPKEAKQDETCILKMWPCIELTRRQRELDKEVARLSGYKGTSAVRIKYADVRATLCQPGGQLSAACQGILLEQCDADLFNYIVDIRQKAAVNPNPQEVMSPEDMRLLALQVIEAYVDCHASNISHRDVKPQNILLKREACGLKVKLCDFGTSYEHGSGGTARGTLVVTLDEGFVWASCSLMEMHG